MTVTLDDELVLSFRTRFVEFDAAAVSDPLLNLYLEEALDVFDLCPRAVIFLAAHLIVLDQVSGVGVSGGASVDGGDGELISDKVGSVSGTYRSMADKGKDTFYTTSVYGRRYIVLRNACSGYSFTVRVF